MPRQAKATPKVYATRPPCKWHEYPCHRPVEAGDTLCAYHQPMARTTARVNYAVRADYHGPLTPDDVDALERGLAFDPGCDCAACLSGVQPTDWPDDDWEEIVP